jgi:hypothetical protein
MHYLLGRGGAATSCHGQIQLPAYSLGTQASLGRVVGISERPGPDSI